MAYSVLNGWTIIPMPASPAAPRQVDFTIGDAVGETVSPWTKQAQVQQSPGADGWDEINLSLPPMTLAQANAWIAWLMSVRGKANAFPWGDPLHATPAGSARTGVQVLGTVLATSIFLPMKGFTASASAVLLPGDQFQLNNRLYSVAGVSAVNADGSGHATVEIWPSLREQMADGAPITLLSPVGLWRLTENQRKWNVNYTRLFGISFKAQEAR